jgi:hypothetical protein
MMGRTEHRGLRADRDSVTIAGLHDDLAEGLEKVADLGPFEAVVRPAILDLLENPALSAVEVRQCGCHWFLASLAFARCRRPTPVASG